MSACSSAIWLQAARLRPKYSLNSNWKAALKGAEPSAIRTCFPLRHTGPDSRTSTRRYANRLTKKTIQFETESRIFKTKRLAQLARTTTPSLPDHVGFIRQVRQEIDQGAVSFSAEQSDKPVSVEIKSVRRTLTAVRMIRPRIPRPGRRWPNDAKVRREEALELSGARFTRRHQEVVV